MLDRMITTPPKPHELGLHDEIPKSARIFDFTDMSRKKGQFGYGYKNAIVVGSNGRISETPVAYALTAEEAKRVREAGLTVHDVTSATDSQMVGFVGKGNLGAYWTEGNLHKDAGVVTVVAKP